MRSRQKTWSDLYSSSRVPSAKDGDRKSYLQKNIIDLYFRYDSEMQRRYFENGALDLWEKKLSYTIATYLIQTVCDIIFYFL